MIKMKKPKKKRVVHPNGRGGASCPCPQCGSPSRVLRTHLGPRGKLRTRNKGTIMRERRCVSPAHHRFHTEERPR